MLGKIRTGVAIALLIGASFAVHSAGLGKLTVSSALGEVLAAEIELVSLQAGEVDSLSARVASTDSYRDAKIEYSSVLRLLRFSVEKRANGQAYLKLTSVAPINEPFVDVLIEVSWPSGRLQREYPILLDPPGFAQAKSATAAVAARPAPAASPAGAAPAAAAPASAPATAVPSTTGAPSAKGEMAAARPALATEPGKDTYGPVEKGETLSKIAGEVKSSSVSMEQMLAALYRENKAAFIDNNMNRLKAGQILRVPSADEVGRIPAKDANQEVRAHVANWRSYREGLAGGVASMPARPESARAATGRVAGAAVTPPAPPATESKDVLKLSKTDSAKAGAAGKGGATQDRLNALQEEVTAKDKALKESQSRVADLEKQIRDMQRLVDLKSGAPAKPGEPAKVADTKVAAAKPAEAPKPAEPAKPAETPKAEVKPAPAPADTKVADAAKPADSAKPADAPKPAETAKPAAPKPPAAKKPAPPPPEPDVMDQLLDNPAIVAGGVGALGLAGLGAFMFVRRRRQKAEGGPTSAMTSAFPSDLKPSTVTGKAGGGLVDTGNSSFLTDFDKTGPGTIDTDEVDPVAEAEVYIAYGRDNQAEEILKEAMSRDKSRHEIPLKLLEIYHARKSATAFETVAKELRGAVGDGSPVWQKAAAMGVQIDPGNPLYGGASGAAAAQAAFEAPAPAAKPDLDFDLDSAPVSATTAVEPEPEAAPASFDLDLGSGAPAQPEFQAVEPAAQEVPALDFDISPAAPAVDMPLSAEAPKEEKADFDFDLSGLDFPSSAAPATPSASAPEASIPDLDLGLGFDQTIATSTSQAQPASQGLTDLDLGEPPATGGGDGVSTKLELAKAYLEIGDKDGAREILTEVAKEGSAAQKDEAQKLIASL
jgi:pilus assembly protein FimV